MDARKALHELREYFEQKRNLAIREKAAGPGTPDTRLDTEADAYNHAMEMVAAYIRELPRTNPR